MASRRSTRSSKKTPAKSPKKSYDYIKISELTSFESTRAKCNVIGIVKEFRSPFFTKNKKYSCSMTLQDESGACIKCLIFNMKAKALPGSCHDGDVLCVRRGIVEEYNHNLQLICRFFSSWLLFRDDAQTPISSSHNASVTNVEKRRVIELKSWAANTDSIQCK